MNALLELGGMMMAIRQSNDTVLTACRHAVLSTPPRAGRTCKHDTPIRGETVGKITQRIQTPHEQPQCPADLPRRTQSGRDVPEQRRGYDLPSGLANPRSPRKHVHCDPAQGSEACQPGPVFNFELLSALGTKRFEPSPAAYFIKLYAMTSPWSRQVRGAG